MLSPVKFERRQKMRHEGVQENSGLFRHVGQHVVFAGVHKVGQLGPGRAQLFGHLAPGLTSMDAGGAGRRPSGSRAATTVCWPRETCARALRNPVNAAALSCRPQRPGRWRP